MSNGQVEVIYEVNHTTKVDKFRCAQVSACMTPFSAVVSFEQGIQTLKSNRLTEETPIRHAMYRSAEVVYIYED